MAIFDHAHPKIIESTFSLPEFVPACKKIFLKYSQFYSPVTRLAIQIFDHAHLKNFQPPFILCRFLQLPKNQLIPSVHSWDKATILESQNQIGHTHFWLGPTKKFWSTFNFCEFVSRYKKWGSLIDLFWRNCWFENPGTWLAASILAYISETRFLTNMGFLHEHCRPNNINFYYRTNSVKINEQIFLEI